MDQLALAQPERKRRYEQLQRGSSGARLAETAWGSAALLHERWSGGLRVRCDRSLGYVAFGALRWTEGEVRWCGAPLAPGNSVRVLDPWELSTSGPVELVAFAVDSAALLAVCAQLAGGEWSPQPGNRKIGRGEDVRLAERLLAMQRALAGAHAEPVALAAAEAELLRIAARLEQGQLAPVAAPSRRRAAVRRIEDFLDACRDEVPSIPGLCAIAGVSERTLEYAFREQLGTTPVRFLKLRRLNRVRRDLLAAEAGASVTTVALRAGVYDLGRFAGEYRQLFGELPSQTLRRGAGSSAGPRHTPPEAFEGRWGSHRFEHARRRDLQ